MKRTRNNLVLGLMLVASASAAAFVIGDLAACVPSSEEVYPRGAVNVVLTPSRATLGEPFTTADGWTIRVSAFVVQALIAGQGPPPDLLTNGAVHLFHATRRQEFLIPRIDEGQAKALISLTSLGIGPDYARIPGYYSGANVDVEPVVIARFAKLADDEDPTPPEDDPSTEDFDESTTVASENGPALLVSGEAVLQGSRTIRFDFTLQASFVDSEIGLSVRRNLANDVVITIAAEQLFNRAESCRVGRQALPIGPRPTHLLFDDVANADRDRDGVLSPAELREDGTPKPPFNKDAGGDAGDWDAGGLDGGVGSGRSLAALLRDHACLIFTVE